VSWQPIETAPKDATEVLVCDENSIFIGQWLKGAHPWNDGAWWVEGAQITSTPTHWMPLPPLPEKTE
jgi:Protein of unknown function (DUF551)